MTEEHTYQGVATASLRRRCSDKAVGGGKASRRLTPKVLAGRTEGRGRRRSGVEWCAASRAWCTSGAARSCAARRAGAAGREHGELLWAAHGELLWVAHGEVLCGVERPGVASPYALPLRRYMRGRLTLEKVNIAINEVATYADANAHLVACPKKKLSEETWEKALALRDIAATESIKGKHFFLEADIKGPGLKLDNTGKAILTVLRHLGRIHETRIGHHRVFILSKQH
ncbi:hypothetical protein GUJ93_ZPchr0013g37562 [Zizania palustris]|uniref:SKA complex subunit 1 homolog n=1 Tax=Zizania palustris TaxID=103762 RepID=A0A8J5X4H0_ZIZPA|nr:hypothetical protein GUJ93_ZPchr0013g37562 [Zizania palustris]